MVIFQIFLNGRNVLKKKKIKLIFLILILISTVTFTIFTTLITNYPSRIQKSKVIKIETSQLSIADTWLPNGTAISKKNYNQWYPQICGDGAGGAIITWEDQRNGLDGDIYAQRVNSTGDVLWTVDGVAICTENNTQGSPLISSDEDGGAIITWNDKRNGLDYDIYAQKINSTGDVQWNANGTAICTANESQVVPQIYSDGTGGAIITWTDYRNGKNYDIFVQRINSTGNVIWNANGTEICTLGGDQIFPKICSDGVRGAIITWEDSRGTDPDIYAQRVNSTGDVQWNANGTAICTANNTQWYPKICSDGTGGAIITWADYRSGTNYDIYTQKINSTGNGQWNANGTAICTADNDQKTPQICSLGTGNAIITWADYRSGTNYDIYTQKINSTGNGQWNANGTAICTADNDQKAPQICSDGNGGALITWEDLRDIWGDIYAQGVNSTGEILGTDDGVAICTAHLAQRQAKIYSDEDGGAIITWSDKRNEWSYDIYAQQIKIEPPLNGDENGDENGDDGDKAFPIEIIIIISSIIGSIAVVGIVTVVILKKRRKIEQ